MVVLRPANVKNLSTQIDAPFGPLTNRRQVSLVSFCLISLSSLDVVVSEPTTHPLNGSDAEPDFLPAVSQLDGEGSLSSGPTAPPPPLSTQPLSVR